MVKIVAINYDDSSKGRHKERERERERETERNIASLASS
jgi:hypothetical protein